MIAKLFAPWVLITLCGFGGWMEVLAWTDPPHDTLLAWMVRALGVSMVLLGVQMFQFMREIARRQ